MSDRGIGGWLESVLDELAFTAGFPLFEEHKCRRLRSSRLRLDRGVAPDLKRPLRSGALGLELYKSGMVDTLKVAREASAASRFAIISASDTCADILATSAAGSHGFISKHQSDTEFLPRSTTFCPGRIDVPCSSQTLWLPLAKATRGAALFLSTEADLSKPTKRQREALELLARGMSNRRSPVR